LFAYCNAKWPNPPIPTTAHFPPKIPSLFIGAKTVTPAHKSGAALF